MDLRAVYEKFGGDYDCVINRLRDEERIKKYLLLFLQYNYEEEIQKALDSGDYETALRESHSLKGVCFNLNLDALGESAKRLTDVLRDDPDEGNPFALMEVVRKDYDKTVSALQALKESPQER